MRSDNPVINVYKKNNVKSRVVTQLLYGDTFKKIKESGSWLKIKNDSDNYKGYIKKKNFPSNQKNTHKVYNLYANLYSKPSAENKIKRSAYNNYKNTIIEANGDFDAAIDVLRKKGQKVAAKRADRDASEGVAITRINSDSTAGIAIVLACETDFVAKNDSFKDLAGQFADIALNHTNKDSFMLADFGGMTVADKLIEQTGDKFGLKGKKIFFPLRAILYGSFKGPDLFTIISILGVEETKVRIKKYIK